MISGRNIAVSVFFVAVLALGLSLTQRFVLIEYNLRRWSLPLLVAGLSALTIAAVGIGSIRLFDRAAGAAGREPVHLWSAYLVGYPIFGTIVFLIASVSTSPFLMSFVLAAGAAAGLRVLRGEWRAPAVGRITAPALILMCAAVLIVLALASLPAVFLDEVAYHLAIPKIWSDAGRAIELPLMSHSYFPLGIESAHLPAIALLGHDGALAAHLLNFIAFLTLMVTLLEWLTVHAPSLAGAATVAILTTPALLMAAPRAENDVPLFGICCVLLFSVTARPRIRHGEAAAAIAAGLLTKYSFGLFLLVIVLVGFVASSDRSRWIRTILLGAISGSVFFVRNLLLEGNPLEPFVRGGWNIARFSATDSIIGVITNYVFDGEFIDASLGIAMFALLLAFAAGTNMLRQWRSLNIAAWGLLACSILLIVISPASRILLPFLGGTSIAGILVLASSSGRARRLVGAMLLIVAAVQLGVSIVQVHRLEPLSTTIGRESDLELTTRLRPEIESVLWANEYLPDGSRSIALGIQQPFWFEDDVRSGGNFDSTRIARYLGTDPDVLARRLEADGFTHVVVFGDSIRVGSEPSEPRYLQRELVLPDEIADSLQQMLAQAARPIAARGNDVVFELSPSS